MDTDQFGSLRKQGNESFRVNIKLVRHFEFKLNTCIHKTINVWGFHKL